MRPKGLREREKHGMGRASASRFAGQTTTLCRTRSLAARATRQAFSPQFRATLPGDRLQPQTAASARSLSRRRALCVRVQHRCRADAVLRRSRTPQLEAATTDLELFVELPFGRGATILIAPHAGRQILRARLTMADRRLYIAPHLAATAPHWLLPSPGPHWAAPSPEWKRR